MIFLGGTSTALAKPGLEQKVQLVRLFLFVFNERKVERQQLRTLVKRKGATYSNIICGNITIW